MTLSRCDTRTIGLQGTNVQLTDFDALASQINSFKATFVHDKDHRRVLPEGAPPASSTDLVPMMDRAAPVPLQDIEPKPSEVILCVTCDASKKIRRS